MSNQIHVSGITPPDTIPAFVTHCPKIEICETDRLCIPIHKPMMSCLLEICVHLSVCQYKIICTPMGNKLVVEGTKHIKILYETDDLCQSVHSACFEIPFCFFMLLEDHSKKICDVYLALEYIKVHPHDCRCFSVNLIIFACAQLEERGCCSDCLEEQSCYPEHASPCDEDLPKPCSEQYESYLKFNCPDTTMGSCHYKNCYEKCCEEEPCKRCLEAQSYDDADHYTAKSYDRDEMEEEDCPCQSSAFPRKPMSMCSRIKCKPTMKNYRNTASSKYTELLSQDEIMNPGCLSDYSSCHNCPYRHTCTHVKYK
jgi:hypothetical protein